MRIRQVKPAFWTDAHLAEQPERVRLFYIGLWMIADDGGWLRWDAAEAARDLYGYESRGVRERRVATMFEALVAGGHVVLHPCGHAQIPHLPEHQRLAGPTKQVLSSMNEHLKECVSRASPQVPAVPRPERNGIGDGTERNGKGTGTGSAGGRARRGAPPAPVSEEDLPEYLRKVTTP